MLIIQVALGIILAFAIIAMVVAFPRCFMWLFVIVFWAIAAVGIGLLWTYLLSAMFGDGMHRGLALLLTSMIVIIGIFLSGAFVKSFQNMARGGIMASIFKDKNHWRAVIRRQGHKSISANFKKKSEASAWAREKESALEKGNNHNLSNKTVAQLVDRYQASSLCQRYGTGLSRAR